MGNKMCSFLRVFGHYGLSQDVQRLIIGNIITHTTQKEGYKISCNPPIKITRVIGGPTKRCQCQSSYCLMPVMTDYVIATYCTNNRFTGISYWDVPYHHECYKEYLDYLIQVFCW